MNAALSKEMTEYVRIMWDRLDDDLIGAGLNEADSSRGVIERFIELYEKHQIVVDKGVREDWATLRHVAKALRAVLKVDMSIDKNRRGGIPVALGLVPPTKIDEGKQRIHQLVYYAMDHARYGTGVPGRSLNKCAELVVDAMYYSGIDQGMTQENAREIYKRILKRGPAV